MRHPKPSPLLGGGILTRGTDSERGAARMVYRYKVSKDCFDGADRLFSVWVAHGWRRPKWADGEVNFIEIVAPSDERACEKLVAHVKRNYMGPTWIW